jgi:flavin reductase (DIM6/NTAB) family NADH-FMN oxidoreductase RutF
VAFQNENPVEACRQVMAAVAAGVAVMTLVDADGVLHGMTISSLTPVSADPPSVLLCVGGAASSRPYLVAGQRFCANVLAADQVAQSMGFAFGEDDPFATFGWTPAEDGTPVLDGTSGHLLCEVERVVDHHGTGVVLAAVIDGTVTKDEALVYWKTAYYGGLIPVEPGVTGRW